MIRSFLSKYLGSATVFLGFVWKPQETKGTKIYLVYLRKNEVLIWPLGGHCPLSRWHGLSLTWCARLWKDAVDDHFTTYSDCDAGNAYFFCTHQIYLLMQFRIFAVLMMQIISYDMLVTVLQIRNNYSFNTTGLARVLSRWMSTFSGIIQYFTIQ